MKTESLNHEYQGASVSEAPELLIPAGGTEQFLAAVENGADAVYVGGSAYSARAGAQNFGREELQEAADYAHQRGVQVHVAMNTLMKDEELEGALRYAAWLYEAGIDALIVQDLGLGALIHRYMPDFPIHMSTQQTAQDLRTVQAAGKLGYTRAVLSRELSLPEIRKICAGTDLEIEVFVHGAICICYSGQCQLSRYIGGRSGNRGACAQPCRLPWKVSGRDGRPERSQKYPLSPKDMCLLDHLGELIDAGVRSFKVEGRMKSPEYVAEVTRIYRKYIDRYLAEGAYQVQPEDRQALEQIFSRGGFTDAYFQGAWAEPAKRETEDAWRRDMMSGNLAKHQGIPVGKVIRRVGNSTLVDVKLYAPLEIGDGAEIQGERLVGNVITYRKDLKGGLTRIGDLRGPVQHGDRLFRISSKAQLEAARKTYEGLTYDAGKFRRKRDIAASVSVSEDGMLTAEACVTKRGDHIELPGQGTAKITAGPFPEAEGRKTSALRFRESMEKTGGTPFRTVSVSFGEGFRPDDADPDDLSKSFCSREIRASEINRVRRQLLAALSDSLRSRRTPVQIPEPLSDIFRQDLSAGSGQDLFVPEMDAEPAQEPMPKETADTEAFAEEYKRNRSSLIDDEVVTPTDSGSNKNTETEGISRAEFWFADPEMLTGFVIPDDAALKDLQAAALLPVTYLERVRKAAGARDYSELASGSMASEKSESAKAGAGNPTSDVKTRGAGQGSSKEPAASETTDTPSGEELTQILDALAQFDEVIPYVSNVTRGPENDFLEQHFREICSACGESGISCGQLGWLAAFADAGVPVYGDFGLNVYNGVSAAVLRRIGAARTSPSLEVCGPENGSWPLMTMAYHPQGAWMTAPKKDRVRIYRSPDREETVLLPADGSLRLDPKAALRSAEETTAAWSPVLRLYIG